MKHTTVLTTLMKKECNSAFPMWNLEHQHTFEAIKKLVLSRDWLTTIDHHQPGNNKIYVTCDVSKKCMGAVLSFGETWESSSPAAFDSRQLKGPELHYPVHKQEMLSIMDALAKWRVNLLGMHINIYTDCKTIENFGGQRDLPPRQVRWMEYLSQYEYSIMYIKGEDNTIADVLSRLQDPVVVPAVVNAVFDIETNLKLFVQIRKGY